MSHTNITVYGAHWCIDCRRAKKFFGEHRIHYDWVDIEQDPDGLAYVESQNAGKRIIPTIVFSDQSILVEPSNADLAAKLGLQTQAQMDYYDLIVIGGGPAGLMTAIYAAREGLETLVIEKSSLGGQVGITELLENFPGFPGGVRGNDFANRLTEQARIFGVELLQAQEVIGLRSEMESRYVSTSDGKEYGARTILIATGSSYRRLDVPGEDEYIGAGIHFCATCDGPFYRNKHVYVVGGGNSAAEESIFLTRFAEKVTLLVRGSKMQASQIAYEKLTRSPKIEIRYNTEVKAFHGNGKLSSMTIWDTANDKAEIVEVPGVFVFIGLTPNSNFLPDEIDRDKYGFIKTTETLETSLPGVFAAGDVRKGSTKQAAAAVGEGATAALSIREYLKTK